MCFSLSSREINKYKYERDWMPLQRYRRFLNFLWRIYPAFIAQRQESQKFDWGHGRSGSESQSYFLFLCSSPVRLNSSTSSRSHRRISSTLLSCPAPPHIPSATWPQCRPGPRSSLVSRSRRSLHRERRAKRAQRSAYPSRPNLTWCLTGQATSPRNTCW